MCVQTCPCGHEYSSYRYFMYYINSLVDSLKALEDDGFKVECFETESFDFTHAPVISVRRREKINK